MTKITRDQRNFKFETLQLHVGQEQADPTTDARAVPIYQTSSYVFRNCDHAAARFGLSDAGNIYGRLTNPTEDVFEKRIAALEGGVAALAVASGAAAVTYTILNLAQNGDNIVSAKNIYGGSFNLFEHTLPQYGIEKADIIFEIPVEGDQTRFMALYADYTTIPQICPIRSCRYYFPALSQGFDAFYVNWGIDDSIADYLELLQLDQYDGISGQGGFFGRDQERLNAGYALEHTGYFDGTKFASVVQAEGRRLDLTEDKRDPAFSFNGLNEQLKPEGSDCTRIDINFGQQSAALTYDAASKTYKKENSGQPQIDAKTGNQLSFTNVFVLETSISVRDSIGHKEVDWDGGDNSVGYYISNGGIQKIHWMKEANNEWSRLKFFDESGNEISINRGKTYIAMNYPNQAVFQ